jgi:DNA-directed RNA polymerase specialized sigma24 family protein
MESIFQEHISELYWLAFLITGDRERSVQAFTEAADGEASQLPAARKLVIAAALETIRRQLREAVFRAQTGRDQLTRWSRLPATKHGHLTKRELEEVLLAMDVFPRCVVILTIMEGLCLEEASRLIGTSEALLKTVQARGVEEMTWRVAALDLARFAADSKARPSETGFFWLKHRVQIAF